MLPTLVKVIGFDLDQTLYPKSPEIDTAIQNYLYEKIAELRQINLSEAKKLFDGLYQSGRGLSGSKSMIVLGFPEGRAKDIVQEALENAPIAKFLTPNTTILSLLTELKQKYESIDIITGSNQSNAAIKMQKLSLPTYLFSHIITADDASKSDYSAFKLWFSFYPKLEPQNFLYIGDRVSSDYEKPRELGIQSILVNIKTPDEGVDCPQLPSLQSIKAYLL